MEQIVKFKSDTGLDVTITRDDVRNVICPNATDKEVSMFMELCRAQRLNPFIKDAYLVKYGGNPASIITGKDVFLKRAASNPRFDGYEAGITVARNGSMERRDGSMLLKGEQLVGAWCKVYVKGYRVPIMDEVALDEYIGRKKDGTPNSQWEKMPATMIRKVALTHALREAFPDDFQGMYAAEEMETATAEPSQAYEVAVSQPHAPEPDQVREADSIKAAWANIAELKKEALATGFNVDEMTAWAKENVGDDMRSYGLEEIGKFAEYLGALAGMPQDAEVITEVYPDEADGYEPFDIEF